MKIINKKFLIIVILALIIGFYGIISPANTHPVLKGSVSAVPQAMYGLWRVVSNRIDTDSPISFKEKGLDLWNLSLENDVIILSNPFSGASAKVEINSVENNSVVFTKKGKYGNKNLTDTVRIKINQESFEGIDELRLDTVSEVNGKVIKTETAKYKLQGEKIAGESILK